MKSVYWPSGFDMPKSEVRAMYVIVTVSLQILHFYLTLTKHGSPAQLILKGLFLERGNVEGI